MASVSNQSSIFPKSNYDIDQCIIGCLNNNESAQVAKVSQAGMAAVRGHREGVVQSAALKEGGLATLDNVAKEMLDRGLMSGKQIGIISATQLVDEFSYAEEYLEKKRGYSIEEREREAQHATNKDLKILLQSGPITANRKLYLVQIACRENNFERALLISRYAKYEGETDEISYKCRVLLLNVAVQKNNKALLQNVLTSGYFLEHDIKAAMRMAKLYRFTDLLDVLAPFA